MLKVGNVFYIFRYYLLSICEGSINDMTIGEALKSERKNLGLTQKEMAGNILSIAAYSKIENDIHKIDADALFKILALHQINESTFYGKIRNNYSRNEVHENTQTLSIKLQRAFYKNDLELAKKLQTKIFKQKNISYELKLRTILTISVLSNNYDGITEKIRKEIFSRIFSYEDWSKNQNSLRLFGSSMFLWNFDNISFAIKDVLNEYRNINRFSREIQERVAQVYVNYLYNCSQYGLSATSSKVIEQLSNFDNIPQLILYKIIGQYYQEYFSHNTNETKEIKKILNNCGYSILSSKLPS